MKKVLLSLVLLGSCMSAFACQEKCAEFDFVCLRECAEDCAERYPIDKNKFNECKDDCYE